MAARPVAERSGHAGAVTGLGVKDRRHRPALQTAAMDDQRQRDAERGHAQRRCRFEAQAQAGESASESPCRFPRPIAAG